jgi:hypothetical protein
MTQLSELTADQGVEKAVQILLEHGWSKDRYYPNWIEFVTANYGYENEDDYNLLERSGVWEAFMEYTASEATDGEFTAKAVATQDDGLAHDSETYFVVLSLTDSAGNTRYFKRDGWYASYDGGHLEEGENSEVFPETKSVTVFEEKK